MSIIYAILNGELVFASQGEALRGLDLKCVHCDAKMHLQKFPLRPNHYFATNKGEEHTSPLCAKFDIEKDPPILMDTPEKFIQNCLRISMKKNESTQQTETATETTTRISESDDLDTPRKLTSLRQLIKVGIYDMPPFSCTFLNSNYKFIDFVVFGKWAHFIWTNGLVYIGPRVIEMRWVGSFSFSENTVNIITRAMKTAKEVWFTTFWRDKEGLYKYVRFCLNCESCFSDIKKKLFVPGTRANGTFDSWMPKLDKLDVLVAANWGSMTKDECSESCPLRKRNKCNECLGAYWGKINSTKQIELFPADNRKKDK